MSIVFILIGVGIVLFILFVAYAACKVSGECSDAEEDYRREILREEEGKKKANIEDKDETKKDAEN